MSLVLLMLSATFLMDFRNDDVADKSLEITFCICRDTRVDGQKMQPEHKKKVKRKKNGKVRNLQSVEYEWKNMDKL